MTDDAAERAFWHSFMEKKDVYKQDGWAARITPVLRELILPRCPGDYPGDRAGVGEFYSRAGRVLQAAFLSGYFPGRTFLSEGEGATEGGKTGNPYYLQQVGKLCAGKDIRCGFWL